MADKMTLADRVIKNFKMIWIRKRAVKVPELSIIKIPAKKFRQGPSLISIVNTISKKVSADEKKEQKKSDFIIVESRRETPTVSGGYGASSKSYGISPGSSYVDYGKSFSYLGRFRAASPGASFENSAGPGEDSPQKIDGMETVEAGARHAKYFSKPGTDAYAQLNSAVPVGGMTADEWSEFKLWVQLNPSMYKLKTTLS